jgi:hypothetical protein
MGEEVQTHDPNYMTLHLIRMQQKHITVNNGSDDLGSIVYADSFYQNSGESLNITRNFPNLLSFYVTSKHYAHCSQNWF